MPSAVPPPSEPDTSRDSVPTNEPGPTRRRRVRAAVLAATVLCGTGFAVVAGQAFAGERDARPIADGRGGRPGGPPPIPTRPPVPTTPPIPTTPPTPTTPTTTPPAPGGGINPPPGVVPVARYRVVAGAQIYTCKAGVVTFKAPEAELARGPRRIHHFAGPSWQSRQDGSLVTATKIGESAVTGAVPELLLQVNSHSGAARGELAKVTFIQRLHTRGGVAPTGPCTEGADTPVPYQAEYVFFAPR